MFEFKLKSSEIATILRMSKSTLLNKVQSGEISSSELTESQQYVYKSKDVAAYLDKNRKEEDTIAVVLQNIKGGVGKTLFVIALSVIFARMGLKVAVFDIDKQANASIHFLGDAPGIEEPTVLNIFEEKNTDGIIYSSNKGVDIIPSNIALENVGFSTRKGIYFFLNDFIEKKLLGKYDYIFIDTPTEVNIPIHSAFIAADYVLSPITPDFQAIYGLQYLQGLIETVNKQYKMRKDVRLLGTILNRLTIKKDIKRMSAVERDFLELKNSGGIMQCFEQVIPNADSYTKIIGDCDHLLDTYMPKSVKTPLINLAFEVLAKVHELEKEKGE